MKNNLYKAVLLAVLGIAGTTAVHAQSLDSDIGLGFNDLTGPGSAHNDYVIDLGSFGQFTTTSTASFNIDSGLFESAFSTDGNEFNDVAVGVVGGHGGVGGLIEISGPMPTTTSASLVDNGLSTVGGTTIGEYSSGATTPTDPWSANVAQSPGQGGYTTTGTDITTAVDNPTSFLSGGDATLTLWEATIGGTTRSQTLSSWTELGTFTIDANDGVDTITYNGIDAAPEPGTYALFAGAGLLAVALRRRFSSKIV